MLKWRKIEAGVYESEDERFYIVNTYDRVYGNHWLIRDRSKEPYKGEYHQSTLTDCKALVKGIMNYESAKNNGN